MFSEVGQTCSTSCSAHRTLLALLDARVYDPHELARQEAEAVASAFWHGEAICVPLNLVGYSLRRLRNLKLIPLTSLKPFIVMQQVIGVTWNQKIARRTTCRYARV